jgi:FkbM family methyltransferase
MSGGSVKDAPAAAASGSDRKGRGLLRRRDFVAAVAGGAVGAGAVSWAWDRNVPDEARMTFAQQGEDIVLFHVIRDLLRLERATYIDVGAYDPVLSSNTYLLWATGHRGVLVEPNPVMAKKLRDYRPGDVVVEAGIGVTDQTEADYYEIRDNAPLNTFSAETAKALQQRMGPDIVERVRKMPLININRLISEQLAGRTPDLVSTDIEGMDYDVIKSLDLSRFRPGAICAETVVAWKPGEDSYITAYLTAQDYVVRGGSTINTVYVDARRLQA